MTKILSQLDQFLLSLNMNAIEGPKGYIGSIVHYTSMSNLPSILQKSGDSFVLWASRYDCLNDTSEGTIVEQRYAEVCDALFDEKLLTDEQYSLFKGIQASRNETFMITKDGNIRPTRCECDSYITSFSSGADLLAMWNYYSKGSMYEGCNIGISSQEAMPRVDGKDLGGKVNIQICPVVYKPEEQSQIIRNMILELVSKYEKNHESSIRAIVSMRLMALKMTYKLEHFEHEQEVRIIVKVARKYRNEVTVNYRAYGGILIPYIQLHIPKASVKFVTLGPMLGEHNQKDLQKSILSDMLQKYEYEAESKCSHIPVRY